MSNKHYSYITSIHVFSDFPNVNEKTTPVGKMTGKTQ